MTQTPSGGLPNASPSDHSRNERKSADSRYSREDLLRILRITPRQLAAWEKAGILTAARHYSFVDLKQAKNIRELCAQKVRPAVIRRSLMAMQRVAGMANPLMEAVAVVQGTRLTFRHQGHTLEPETGQLLLDFFDETARKSNVVAKLERPPRPTGSPSSPGLPGSKDAPQGLQAVNYNTAGSGANFEATEIADLFSRGIALEEDPETQNEAIACYQRVLELEQRHAAAHINLGTIYYNRQLYLQAEMHYRCAVEADPRYALAYFDLGNVLDETGRILEAISTYQTAVGLAPTYGDAHYNLALAFEKLRHPRKALRHWREYVKLDSVGPWAVHARTQIRKILAADGLRVVR